MTSMTIKKYKFFILALVLPYSLFFAFLPVEGFSDRTSYLIIAESPLIHLAHYLNTGGWLGLLTNEPGWLAINLILSFFLEPELIIRVIVFISAFIFGVYLVRKNPRNLLFIFLLLVYPQITKNFTLHLRQGLAITIFFIALNPYGARRYPSIMILTSFIHSSFIIINLIFYFNYLCDKLKFSIGLRLVIFSFLSIIGINFLPVIAEIAGFRQAAQYDFEKINVGGLGFLLYLIFFILLLHSYSFLKLHSNAILVCAFYLLTYFTFPLSARILESGLLFIFFAGVELPRFKKYLFLTAMAGSSLFAGISFTLQ